MGISERDYIYVKRMLDKCERISDWIEVEEVKKEKKRKNKRRWNKGKSNENDKALSKIKFLPRKEV